MCGCYLITLVILSNTFFAIESDINNNIPPIKAIHLIIFISGLSEVRKYTKSLAKKSTPNIVVMYDL